MSEDADQRRKQREQAFHDDRFADETRGSLSKYYEVDAGKSRYAAWVRTAAPADQRVLEYGCGVGSMAFDLAASGATVTGIDISGVAIANARTEAHARGVDVQFLQMDAERLSLEDQSFELVCGSGILHHLDLEKALPEIARVLVPDGTAVFMEPLGHNPFINLYRRLTPKLRTDDEHPLLMADLELAERSFGSVEVEYFNLLTLAAVPVRRLPWGRKLIGLLGRADQWLFDNSSVARRWAWVVVIRLTSRARVTA